MNMTKICEHDQKIHNDEHSHGEYDQNILRFLVVKKLYIFNMFFGHAQRLMLVGVIFWSSSNVKVCQCKDFLVKI